MACNPAVAPKIAPWHVPRDQPGAITSPSPDLDHVAALLGERGGTADESNGVGFFTDGSSVLPPLLRQHHPDPGYSLLQISVR